MKRSYGRGQGNLSAANHLSPILNRPSTHPNSSHLRCDPVGDAGGPGRCGHLRHARLSTCPAQDPTPARRWRRDWTAWGRRSSRRCPRWRCPPGRSTSARASPTPTVPTRWPRPRSPPSATGHNQYPPGPGIPDLRLAIAEHQQRFYGLALDPDTEVVVTTGATEAVAAALLGLVDPGDEVIALEPFYDSYTACIAMAGGPPRARHVAGARLPARRRPAACRGQRPHPADPAQHAAQPDRHGADPRSCRRWPTSRSSATCSWSPTRSTSTWRTTSPTSRLPRCPAWPSAP